jgi:periplasmic copper chaperone A
MSDNMIRSILAGLMMGSVLVTSSCSSSPEQEAGPMADQVTFENQWAGSADEGMTAVFGTFTNTGGSDARIVAGTSPAAGSVEVHEVVPDAAGGKVMQSKEGGLVVPAGETRELIPGGDHLMLMDLTEPLRPGADVTLTVEFEDGSTLPVTAQVRDFAGANENYVPSTDGAGGPHKHG